MIYTSILETIGHTPVVKINRLAPENISIYVKLEFFNPLSSVKDRLAHGIILDAELKGELQPGQTVIESTSGNTGISLAMVCAAKGYPFVAIMSETFSIERRKLMRALGAQVILTPAEARGSGAARLAEELAGKNNWFLANQFRNPANVNYHKNTTAAEILGDFADHRLDYFLSGYGTGGTISGVGAMLKAARPEVKVIAAEPVEAPMLQGKGWSSHKLQGWTPDFIADVMDQDIYDEVISVDADEAKECALNLAKCEGILCGISSGATFAAALRIAADAVQGSTILCILPDTGERYLSTYLYEGMDDGTVNE